MNQLQRHDGSIARESKQEMEQKEKHVVKNLDDTDTDNPIITVPRPTDILCGKDKECVTHEGSYRFRAVIDEYYERYRICRTKQQKMEITKEIVGTLQNSRGSRFLKYDTKTKAWQEISQMAARDKVSHALRFASQRHERQDQRKQAARAKRPSQSPSDSNSYSAPAAVASSSLPPRLPPEITEHPGLRPLHPCAPSATLPPPSLPKPIRYTESASSTPAVQLKTPTSKAKLKRHSSDSLQFTNEEDVKYYKKLVERQRQQLIWIHKSRSDPSVNALLYDTHQFVPVPPLPSAADTLFTHDDDEIASIMNEPLIDFEAHDIDSDRHSI